jgi:TetR/AcrR family transcriptional regulator, transcriptional repressor of aconitase
MPKTTAEAKEVRRDAILEAAQRTFAQYGYEGATVARLEQATGLSRGGIFNYFPTKDDLFLALAERDAERIGALWLEHGYEDVLRYIDESEHEWLGVYLEIGRRLRTDEDFRERWRQRAPEVDRRLAEDVRRLQEEGELRDDVDVETLGRFLGLVADGIAMNRAAGFPTPPFEDLLLLVGDAIGGPARLRTRPRRSA